MSELGNRSGGNIQTDVWDQKGWESTEEPGGAFGVGPVKRSNKPTTGI